MAAGWVAGGADAGGEAVGITSGWVAGGVDGDGEAVRITGGWVAGALDAGVDAAKILGGWAMVVEWAGGSWAASTAGGPAQGVVVRTMVARASALGMHPSVDRSTGRDHRR
jgi:hypothetical protein